MYFFKQYCSLYDPYLSDFANKIYDRDFEGKFIFCLLVSVSEGRKMTDIKTKLQDNSLHQRNTHMAANYNAKSREKMESQERIKVVMVNSRVTWVCFLC